MNLTHVAQRASLDQLDSAAQAGVRATLRAHLRGHFRSGGHSANHAGFVHRMRQRLLAIHVLAQLHRHHRGGRVAVVGRADHDGVDILSLVEHLAKVAIARGLGIRLERLGGAALIDVAQRHDVLAGNVRQVAGSLAAGADDGDVQRFAGRLRFGPRTAGPIARAQRQRGSAPRFPEIVAGWASARARRVRLPWAIARTSRPRPGPRTQRVPLACGLRWILALISAFNRSSTDLLVGGLQNARDDGLGRFAAPRGAVLEIVLGGLADDERAVAGRGALRQRGEHRARAQASGP